MKNKKKCIFGAGMVTCLASAAILAGCGKQEPVVEPIDIEPVIMSSMEEPIVVDGGSWTIHPEDISNITDEDRTVFEKGMEGLDGVGYEPIAKIATQVVAGQNHLFIAKGTAVYPGAEPQLYAICMYEDLEHNVNNPGINKIDLDFLGEYAADSSLSGVKLIDPNGEMTTDIQKTEFDADAPETGMAAGGWTANMEYPREAVLTDEQLDAFHTADDGVIPIAYLGNKAAETTRADAFLCKDTIFRRICIVIVNQDTATGAFDRSVTNLDFVKLVTSEELR